MSPAAKVPFHPIANTMPMMGTVQLNELAESIARSGQRHKIVLLDGSILDGRNRYEGCLIAKVEPQFRDFGSEPSDGDSPTRFVVDENFERRHLTTGQQAGIGALMIPFFEAEAKERQSLGGKGEPVDPKSKGTALEAAAKSVGVSKGTMATVVKLQAEAPEKFQAVIDGKTTVNAAAQEAQDEAREAEEKKAREDNALQAKRDENAEEVGKICGAEFAEAFKNATILKTAEEVDGFLALSTADRKAIREYVVRGWSIKDAVKFMARSVTRKDPISDLLLRTANEGKKSGKYVVDGWEITIKRVAEETKAE